MCVLHLETDAGASLLEGYVAARIRGLDDLNAVAGVTTEAIERQLQQADGGYADYERNSVRLLERVALLLMPVDRRFAGTSGELRH